MEIPREWAAEDFCYVTTTGRNTGRPHRIEIWFALAYDTFYLLAEGRHEADWVRNMMAKPEVTVQVKDVTFDARARFEHDTEDEEHARRLLATKYQEWTEGAEMSNWARTATLVALEPE